MSLTRSLLKELQISPDAAERIIAAHAESIDALRQERDAARGEAAQLESIRAALAEMTQARDEACQARDSAREELSALGGQFDSYRQQVEAPAGAPCESSRCPAKRRGKPSRAGSAAACPPPRRKRV